MFTNCKTLEELKKEYHRLVMLHHPDRGGELEKMQAINVAYDKFFPLLKNTHINKEGELYERANEETPEYFKNVVKELLKMGLTVEIIGCFVWVSGETKPHKDKLKEMGFKWHSKKACWYLSPADYKRFGKKEYDIEEIRGMYGSKKYQGNAPLQLV